ncbi:MAG TPA: hypothetical protein VIK99_10960 [Thermaerobacter sp.]
MEEPGQGRARPAAGSPGPTRRQMEVQLARQFGYDDWETFRAEAEKRLGRQVVRRLEQHLERYPER